MFAILLLGWRDRAARRHLVDRNVEIEAAIDINLRQARLPGRSTSPAPSQGSSGKPDHQEGISEQAEGRLLAQASEILSGTCRGRRAQAGYLLNEGGATVHRRALLLTAPQGNSWAECTMIGPAEPPPVSYSMPPPTRSSISRANRPSAARRRAVGTVALVVSIEEVRGRLGGFEQTTTSLSSPHGWR